MDVCDYIRRNETGHDEGQVVYAAPVGNLDDTLDEAIF
jgi:hypothetical protein